MKMKRQMLWLTPLLVLILISSVSFASSSALDGDIDNNESNMGNGDGNTIPRIVNGTLAGNGTQTGIDMDKSKKTVNIESETLMVMINAGGEVPIYQFWSIDDNDTKYHVKFQKIQEFSDDNDNGLYENNETVGERTLSLQSVGWILSDAIVDDEQITFNFTSETIQQSQFSEFKIKIVNHINIENATALKFDIYMSGWPFMSVDNMLSLRWDLTWTNEDIDYETLTDGIYLKQNDETLAHFTYESEVMIGETSDTVTASYLYNDSKTVQNYFNYPNFKDTELVHDPEIGVDGIISSDDESSDIVTKLRDVFPHISKDGFIITTAIAAFLLVGLFGWRKRKF
ncbi:MAG: hypothetical protein ACFFDT_22795 [Candidatus Hodarchaeota archaeon]